MEIGMLSPFGKIVWEDRYAQKNEQGELLEKDISETFKRVSKAIASKEKDPEYWGNKFYQVMIDQLFCPAGRVLAHSGTHYSQLLNCFVLPFNDDSLEEIMNTAKNMAIVQKFGGGCINGESLVLTNKGPIPLKEIVEGGDSDLQVLSFNPDNFEMEYCDILERHTTPLSGDRVFEIEFDNVENWRNSKIRASDWHPFFVFDGEKVVQVRADELKPGMAVIGSTNFKEECTFNSNSMFDTGWMIGTVDLSHKWKENLNNRARIKGSNSDPFDYWLQHGKANRAIAAAILRECGEEKLSNAVLSSQIVCSSKAMNESETLYDLTIAKNQTYLASDPIVKGYVVVHNTGFNFSRLRPSGSYIKGVNGRSSGIIGFVSMMSTVSEVIEQGGCFTSNTFVATIVGPKKIKNLRKGDYVYSMSEKGFALNPCAGDAFLTKRHSEVWRVLTNNNFAIYCTKDHPFMPKDGFDFKKKNYVKARDLKSDLPLMSFSEDVVKDMVKGKNLDYIVCVDHIYAKSVKYFSHRDVWNVEVENAHNFVVCDPSMRTGVVVSNTRRGANIGLLEVWHPDVWEFISYKTEHNWECLREFIDVNDFDKWESFKYENLYKWQMFNVSVGITDEFLEAVKNDKEWTLRWGDDEWLLYKVIFKKCIGGDNFKEFEFEVTANNEKTAIWKTKRKVPYPTSSDKFEIESKRKIRASEIWDRICYNAWADGCPGIINLSTARKMHNLEYCSPIEATNPCLHGDTLVAVADGRNAVSIRQLAEEENDVPVYCRDNNGRVVIRMMRHPRITGYNQKLLKILINNGGVLKLTENHEVLLSNGCYVSAGDLKKGDILSSLAIEELGEDIPSGDYEVMGIEEGGFGTVYNGTVDDYHNYYFGAMCEKGSFFTNGKNCGEQLLGSNGSCNLSSILLPNFVIEDTKSIDWDVLRNVVHIAVRFSDNVLDNCKFPISEIEKIAYQERRVGIGTMGVHDMLIKMGLDYDSDLGRKAVGEVLEFIRDEAYTASIAIAKEKGSFPAYKKSKFLKSGFIKTLPKQIIKLIEKTGIRNGSLLSQAPTGSVSALNNLSSGCEPWYSLSFQRNTRLGSYEDGCATYIEWKKKNPNTPKPSYFKTAPEISPEDHVKMLTLFSKYIDSSVSKTVNLPNSATVEIVKDTFIYAMINGVKGITIFRDGSKEGVLVSKDKETKTLKNVKKVMEEEVKEKVSVRKEKDYYENVMSPKKRGDKTVGSTYRIHLQNHNLYVTVNRNKDGELVEIFTTVGESKIPNAHHTSGVEDSWAEGLGKIISLALRAGVKPSSIITNLKNIPSDKPVFTTIGDNESSEHIPSPPHAIARVIEEEMVSEDELTVLKGGNCVECGSTNTKKNSSTCYECIDCGYVACG